MIEDIKKLRQAGTGYSQKRVEIPEEIIYFIDETGEIYLPKHKDIRRDDGIYYIKKYGRIFELKPIYEDRLKKFIPKYSDNYLF